MADVVQHAWIAARAADLSPAIARESERVPDVDLLIVASNKALLGATFPPCCERARRGAHVYVSWFAGVHAASAAPGGRRSSRSSASSTGCATASPTSPTTWSS